MNKTLLRILKWIFLLALTVFIVIAGLSIYLINKVELSDCAFSPIDQIIVLDKKTTDGKTYTLVYAGGGSWQDKTYQFKIYAGPIKSDECGRENLRPLWTEIDTNSSRCPKSVRFKGQESELVYAERDEQCIPTEKIKFER